MHVVATAGHVDHGKSTLVESLTGRHPDRLREERQRGLSIELGYCWTDLAGVGEVAFVDVPGHQRFIATTLAGVGPVPVAMFVVAADDPWMPQAAEHLAALDALDVRRGVLVVTRSDLADPAVILARARAELDATSLAGAPAVTVSGRTGAGLAELRSTLAEVLRRVPAVDPAADVRLWVDRRFHVRGTGTVVTGTLATGSIATGDVLEAGADRVRVRGIEALEVPRDRVDAVARVALDLGGRAPERIDRGTPLVTPDAFSPTAVVDVRLVGAAGLPERPLLHVGSALVGVHARPLGDDFARLRLERPLPLRVGDHALLRDPGSRELWGIRVVDPMPPALTGRGAATERARTLRGHDGTLRRELGIRGIVRASDLAAIGVPSTPMPGGAVRAGDWLVGAERARELRAALRELVDRQPPLAGPLTTAAAAHRLGVPAPEIVSALVAAPLREEGGAVLGPGDDELPAAAAAALAGIRESLATNPFAAPDRSRLRELGADPAVLAALQRNRRVLRLAEDVVLLPDADARAAAILRELPQPFTASEARTALGTSRRVALPLLDHLDRSGRTHRLPDDRRRSRDGEGD